MERVSVAGYSYEWSVYGHSYRQTLVNSDAIENFVKIVKYFESLAKV